MYQPSKQTWLNPNLEYLFDEEIIEYDMSDAGFSIIRQFHLLPDDEIQRLQALPKGFQRNQAVGILQRDRPDFNKAFLNQFTETRSIFLHMNGLTDDRILSVKKDAFFTIGTVQRTKFGLIRFAQKNHYTSYLRFPAIQNMELYYGDNHIDVKGMGDEAVNRHRLFLLDRIQRFIQYMESQNPYVKRYLITWIDDYKQQRLSEEFYVQFNNMSRTIDPLFNLQKVLIPLVQIVLREMR